MKIRFVDGKLSVGSLFKVFAIGFAIGEGLLFGIPFLLIFALSILTGLTVGFENMEGIESWAGVFIMPVLLPVIVLFHSVMFAGLATMGLWIYTRKRTIDAEYAITQHETAVTSG